jgi:DNA-binding NarL/FixJ family response regulator
VQRRNPLASSYYRYLRLAPVPHPLMISDRRRILVGDATAEAIWTSTDPELVSRAVHFYDELWRAAPPAVPDGEQPPFTRRMVDVALLLVDGATDREIARSLGVSERTVSAEVREMSRRLGARSRAHAIALISGVEG